MIFGKLRCWIVRWRGGRHKYNHKKGTSPTDMRKCVRCGHQRKERKAKQEKA